MFFTLFLCSVFFCCLLFYYTRKLHIGTNNIFWIVSLISCMAGCFIGFTINRFDNKIKKNLLKIVSNNLPTIIKTNKQSRTDTHTHTQNHLQCFGFLQIHFYLICEQFNYSIKNIYQTAHFTACCLLLQDKISKTSTHW